METEPTEEPDTLPLWRPATLGLEHESSVLFEVQQLTDWQIPLRKHLSNSCSILYYIPQSREKLLGAMWWDRTLGVGAARASPQLRLTVTVCHLWGLGHSIKPVGHWKFLQPFFSAVVAGHGFVSLEVLVSSFSQIGAKITLLVPSWFLLNSWLFHATLLNSHLVS